MQLREPPDWGCTVFLAIACFLGGLGLGVIGALLLAG